MRGDLRELIFRISKGSEFENIALEIFRLQFLNCPVYNEYVSVLGTDINSVNSLEKIPFLPIEFFKNHRIITGNSPCEKVFESSGTTETITSRHYITDLSLYEESFVGSFRYFYGDPEDYFFAALLPSYIERENSSLVYMADYLIRKSSDHRSSFFLGDKLRLLETLKEVKTEKRKGMLIGVTFALLDLAEEFVPDLSGIIVVETGGMKGRRKEVTREELHNTLKEKLHASSINSEYGMTELLSQAWSKGDGIFQTPPWMKIILREINDPLTVFTDPGITGGINIIDLANINSCSFISTGDLGRLNRDGGFEVLGRFGNSDLRGCNLLI